MNESILYLQKAHTSLHAIANMNI